MVVEIITHNPNTGSSMRHIKLEIDVGEADVVDLKIKSGGLIGTLHLEKSGLAFSPPKAKKDPEHRISWSRLPQLVALSNGFAKLQEEK